MTDEQIIALVKEHFTEGGIHDDGSCSEWYGNTDAFVKFAKQIYRKGKSDGYENGYDDGCFEATGGN